MKLECRLKVITILRVCTSAFLAKDLQQRTQGWTIHPTYICYWFSPLLVTFLTADRTDLTKLREGRGIFFFSKLKVAIHCDLQIFVTGT